MTYKADWYKDVKVGHSVLLGLHNPRPIKVEAIVVGHPCASSHDFYLEGKGWYSYVELQPAIYPAP
jgi:hypothetical protein